jgi:nucleotide-binding universal stress UspA family protein
MTHSREKRGSSPRPMVLRRPIVVGVDSDIESETAVAWAAQEALSRELPLTIVHAWSLGPVDMYSAGSERLSLRNAEQQADLVGRHHARLVQDFPQLPVCVDVVQGSAARVLLDYAADATTLVLGTRVYGVLSRVVLGSVSTSVAASAECPVVVLCHPPGTAYSDGEVVVGVSGLEHDETVLGFACEHASRNRLPLRAVLCWNPGIRHYAAPADDARRYLAEAVAGWRERFPELRFEGSVQRGHPVEVLSGRSAGQALLVVGRHARRAHFGTALGSVSRGVLHHSHCPVAVIPQE